MARPPSLITPAVKSSVVVMIAVKKGAESTKTTTAITVTLTVVIVRVRDMVPEGAR